MSLGKFNFLMNFWHEYKQLFDRFYGKYYEFNIDGEGISVMKIDVDCEDLQR